MVEADRKSWNWRDRALAAERSRDRLQLDVESWQESAAAMVTKYEEVLAERDEAVRQLAELHDLIKESALKVLAVSGPEHDDVPAIQRLRALYGDD